MGTIVNDLYDDAHADTKKENPDWTSVEIQRKSIELTFKRTSVIQMEEWRKYFEVNGYIKFPEVIYKASELPMLKGLQPEDIKCLHLGKKVMKGTIQQS